MCNCVSRKAKIKEIAEFQLVQSSWQFGQCPQALEPGCQVGTIGNTLGHWRQNMQKELRMPRVPVLAVPVQEIFPFFFLEQVLGAVVPRILGQLMERNQDLGMMAPVIGTARAAGLQSHHGIMEEPWPFKASDKNTPDCFLCCQKCCQKCSMPKGLPKVN